MIPARRLQPGDEAAVRSLFCAHADSSMSLWSNLEAAGLADRPERFHGTWVGAFRGGELVGAAMHAWNGHLLVQAPAAAAELATLAARESGRRVEGIVGPWEQAVQARQALGLQAAPTRVCENEVLFAIDLSLLRQPAPLQQARAPLPSELDQVVAFRNAYARELNLERADPQRLRDATRAALDKGDIFITIDGGEPVAMTALNARLPDRVQVGGVFTPEELRGRGYARSAVFGHLRALQAAGAVRATLFTRETNLPAQACYRALGFVPVGRYALILFEVP